MSPAFRRGTKTTLRSGFAGLAFDRVDLDRFHAHAHFFEPGDGAFYFLAITLQLEGNEADLFVDAGLADVEGNLEFLAELPNHRTGDEPRGIHEPKTMCVCRHASTFDRVAPKRKLKKHGS